MKNVTQYVGELSLSDLTKAVLEINELHQTAVLGDGVVRTLARKISQELGISVGTSLTTVESSVLIRAALLWAEWAEGQK